MVEDVQESQEVAFWWREHSVVAVDQVHLSVVVDHGAAAVWFAVSDDPGLIGLVEPVGQSVGPTAASADR